ncbi:MAG: hypothetical protein AABX13_00655 [Nanoarchaeota archaeon]
MSKTIDTLLFAGGLALAAGGVYTLLTPQEGGRNRVEQAAIMMDTAQAQEYAQRALPGAAAYYGGAAIGLIGLTGLERGSRKKIKKVTYA